MQSSVLARNEMEEKKKRVDSISENIRAIAQENKLEFQTFKISTEKLENGISIEFEMRAKINFSNRSESPNP